MDAHNIGLTTSTDSFELAAEWERESESERDNILCKIIKIHVKEIASGGSGNNNRPDTISSFYYSMKWMSVCVCVWIIRVLCVIAVAVHRSRRRLSLSTSSNNLDFDLVLWWFLCLQNGINKKLLQWHDERSAPNHINGCGEKGRITATGAFIPFLLFSIFALMCCCCLREWERERDRENEIESNVCVCLWVDVPRVRC